MPPLQRPDWRTMAALNVVSVLAQIGQFGFAYVVLPVWLAQQGLDATQLGLFAASLWLGQLPGLAVAPRLIERFGARWVVVAGLLCTAVALPAIALTVWPAWLAGGVLAGFGLGLRWIGVEPWLYRIAPSEARGRMVGLHESLIALAPVIAPGLAGQVGVQGSGVFWLGTLSCLSALVPLALARDARSATVVHQRAEPGSVADGLARDAVTRQGVIIALLGGMMEAAISGLFALFAEGRGLGADQTANLLVVFGLGGLLMQYAAGWLADRHGLGYAARACAVGATLVALALLLPSNPALILVAVFLLGGFITAFLTLALVAGTAASSDGMAASVSRIAMLYTASAIAGPLVAGAIMQATHTDALMAFTAAACMVLALGLGRGASAVRAPAV